VKESWQHGGLSVVRSRVQTQVATGDVCRSATPGLLVRIAQVLVRAALFKRTVGPFRRPLP
jgi:hypothetical protein